MKIVIEFIFVIVFALLGNFAHITQTFTALDKKYPEKEIGEIKKLWWENEFSTLIGSVCVFLFNITTQAALQYYTSVFEMSFPVNVFGWFSFSFPVVLASFAAAFVFGYSGQYLMYLWLGKGTSYLESKLKP